MAKISGSIPNFANGISQQAMALRLATQGEFQLNAYSTVVDGLKKRPPTNARAFLGTDITSAVYTHQINRDVVERYEVLIAKTGVRVFDLATGQERDVNAPSGVSYLNYPGSPKELPYRAITVGDYTFITNQTKVPALAASPIEPVSPSEAIIHVMAGNYGKDYKVLINGNVVGWYRTPDGTSAAQSPAVDTNYIARRLATGETVELETTINDKPNGDWVWKETDTHLSANGITPANGWTVRVTKGTIYVKRNDGSPFSISVEDGYNGHAMKAIQHSVQDFSDLPSFTEDGMAIEVTGSVSTEFDNYYVRFGKLRPEDPISTPGVWREIPKPGIKVRINAATMPHILVREADGTFTFKPAEWDDRKAGDDDTVPVPSFIGSTVNEMFFFKNRLGILSGENVVMSRAGSYYDFWRATATTLLDDDPIDVAAAENGVSILRSCETFADRLVLFADQKQFTLMGNEMLTQKTVSIRPSTAYQASNTARPVSTGDAIFFPVSRGQFSMIREYRIDEATGSSAADDITAHAPQYIPGDILKMAASTHEDILVVKASGDPSALYVYKWYRANEQKLQASWSEWRFPGVTEVLDMGFIGSQLIMVVLRGSEAHLEVMDVQPGGSDDYSHFVTHLDRRFRIEPAEDWEYDPYNDETYIPMETDVSRDDYICVTAGSPTSPVEPGMVPQFVERGPGYVTLFGDWRGVPLHFGLLYEMRYRMSTIFVRQDRGNGGVSAITEGRLQLLQLIFQYAKTAYFKVEVQPLGRQRRSYVTNGRLMGDPENKTDRVHTSDGSFRVPILSKNDRVVVDIVNDSYLPCALLAAEWVGNYFQKSRRI